MEQVQKAVLNRETNRIIFLYKTFSVAFTYRGFIFEKRTETRGTVLEQFIKEFAISKRHDSTGLPDADFMSRDVQGYCRSAVDFYDKEVNHEAAVVVYTLENGFGIQ